MNTFSKGLSMFLVVVMCFSLFATSAFATNGFDFGDGTVATAAGSGFNFEQSGTFAGTGSSDTFTLDGAASQANSDSFTLDADAVQTAETSEAEDAVDEVETAAATNNFSFTSSNSATFETKYSEMEDPEFSVTEINYTKNSGVDVTITLGGGSGTFDGDTFSNGFAYSTSATGSSLTALTQGSHYKMETGTLTIYASWLDTLDPGVYYFYGRRIDDVPVKLGFINVNKGEYDEATIVGSPYEKPALYDTSWKDDYWDDTVTATGDAISEMDGGFGIAAVSGSYTHILSAGSEYLVDGDTLTLSEKYLNNLSDGEYYIIGFPVEGSTSEQAKLGKFIVMGTDASLSADGILTPDGQVWYSGTDPLTFYCDIFEDAGLDWNYKGYTYGVIVPDIRVATNSSMTGATSVRIDQYWDLGYGYFMLGQNFLNTLSADETYYMQVIDARHPDDLYSNVVSFRVGPTLRAIDTDKHVLNSTRSLRFRSSATIAEVYVGNIQLTDAADYGVSWDGKTVTLSFEFLNKRSGGNTYTIKVRTTDGEWASTTFQVLTTAQGSASPRTGDESNLGLWAAFLLLSGTAVVVLVPKLKRHDI